MPTKSELLKRANNEFPEHYAFVKKENPSMRLPALESFPTVTKMTIEDIAHEYGTEAKVTLAFTTASGEQCEVVGAAIVNHWDNTADFSGVPLGTKEFAEEFVSNLLYNIMCEEGLFEGIEEWQGLPE